MEEDKLKERIGMLAQFYSRKGRMPSFSELGKMVGLKSKNAVSKLVRKLEEMKVIGRDETGRLIPGSLAQPIKLLGTVEAGFPSPAEEELVDTISLDDFFIQNRLSMFMLKVSGDSMVGAGILPGDMVLVDKSLTPANGDIVIAEVDGEWTMKYLKKQRNGVILEPANDNYKSIKPSRELKIAGVVTAVMRKCK